MVTILGANSVSGGYEVTNSLRLNDDDTPRFDKTLGTPTNTDKFTASFWFKKCKIAAAQTVFAFDSGGAAQSYITFTSDDKLEYYNRLGSGNASQFTTNRLFRDVSAWYHIVVAVDSTDGTAGDRCKIYVNGVRETSFATSNFADQNQNQNLNSALAIRLFSWSSGEQVDGYISELYFIDGAAKAPTDFGKTNDDGVWIPIDYSGAYGDNGYRFEFKQTGTGTNASGIGADTSGETNHWAVTNLAAIDVTTDTCTNNFATINSLLTNDGSTHSEGNTKLVTPDGPGISGPTIAMTAGKWYAEFTCTAKSTVNMNVGIVRADSFDGDNQMDEGNNIGYMYQNNGNIFHGGANESYGASWAVDDIIGIAFNADNLNVEFFKNGVGQGNYTRIASENTGGDWFMCVGEGQGGSTATFECNFGNPPSAVSSSNADADGHGNFEHAPPSGYFALCTKNLAEYG